MSSERIDLREQEERRDVPMSSTVAVALRRSALDMQVSERRPDVYDLRARNTVGSWTLHGVTVTVRPKIPVARLAWMLEVAGRVPPLGDEISVAPTDDLLTVVQRQYVHALALALRQGVVRDYQAASEDLTTVRGTIDWLAVHTRRYGRVPPAPCRFDDFDVDHDINRVLLAAARALARWQPGEAAAALQRLAAKLEGVSEWRYRPQEVPDPPLDRRHRHLERALRLAQLVLRRASLEQEPGDVRAVGMIVEMARLYEDFVIVALRDALGADHRTLVARPPPIWLDPLHSAYALRLDGVLRSRSGQSLAVIDAKYKSGAVASEQDVYQMLAYLDGTRAQRGVLVYADVPAREIHTSGDKRILTVRIGLAGSREEILQQVGGAAARIADFTGWRLTSASGDALAQAAR
jgi:5-methylcytosine-specific restriction enzyme subunit McrC